MYQSDMVEQQEAPQPVEQEFEGNKITRDPRSGDITVVSKLDEIRARVPSKTDFDANLAILHPDEFGDLPARLQEFYLADIESRKDWQEREKRSLDMLGVVDTIPPEDTKAPGMNKVTHPMLMEATVRFSSQAFVELFPPKGPSKPDIVGEKTREVEEKADRIETFTNFYLTKVDTGYYPDSDQMLFYLPTSGSVFRKGSQDWTTGMPRLRYVKATSFIAPYAGTSLESMPRYAHEYTMTGQELRQAIQIGMFKKNPLIQSAGADAHHNETADRADGRENNVAADDIIYSMLEYHIDLDLSRWDDKVTAAHKNPVRSYIVIVDKEFENVWMVRRNWEEKDPLCRKEIWFAHHKYLPGLGFYGFGLPHVIGSLGNAASGAVNALLDASQMATFQGGFKAKTNARLAGELRLDPGTWKDVDASYEDLAKSFYTPPFKEPSPALFNMLHDLVDAGQRFAGTADVAVGDANNNAPVGTTLALIEQAQKPQSAIHKRLHVSMCVELAMFARLVRKYMPDRYPYKIGTKENVLLRSDFDGDIEVISVTDPDIYSDTQRINQGQALLQLVQQFPDLFTPAKKAEVLYRMMKAMKIPDLDAIKPEAEQPKYVDAVTENGLILRGKGVRVYDEQDDQAHLTIHQQGAASAAAAQMDPNTQQAILASYGVHIRDHMAQLYRKQIFTAAGIPYIPLDDDGNPPELPPDVEAKITSACLAKLPPPPPPPQGSPNAKAQQADELHQQKLKSQQETHEQQLQQQAEAHAQKMQSMQAENEAAIERHTQDFLAKQKQAQAGAKVKDKLENVKTAAAIKRKDKEAAAGIIRKGAEAKTAMRMKRLDHEGDHRQKAVGHHLTLHAQHQEAMARIEAKREEARAAREERRKDAEQQRAQAEQAHKQSMAQGAEANASTQRHGEEMNRQKRVAGKIGLQQKRQATKIAAKKKPAKRK